MDKLVIEGGKRLTGTIKISGSKNGALATSEFVIPVKVVMKYGIGFPGFINDENVSMIFPFLIFTIPI